MLSTMRDAADLRRLWRLPLRALGFNLHEASELAAVLEEAAPDTIFFDADEKEALRSALSSRSHAPSSLFAKRSLHERIKLAVPECIDEGVIDWSRLSAAVSTESLSQAAAAAMGSNSSNAANGKKKAAAVQLELNSGGRVFFLLFRPPEGVLAGSESLAVVKFAPSRLLMQAEQFANELTRHLDIIAPDCRVVRQAGVTSTEWQAVVDAVSRLGPKADGLDAELAALPCFLLMQYIRGKPLLECGDAFEGMHVPALFEDLGRLFLLDMVLGNADRLPCIDLGWRGNPNNIMNGARGTVYAGRAIAIDSCVQRRPPAARLSHEDAAVDRLAQLLLNDAAFALATLRGGLMAGSRGAVAALAARPGAYVASFQHGFRSCLDKVVAIKGLLEMIHQKMSEWVLEFLTDIKQHKPQLHLPGDGTPGPSPAQPLSAGGRALRRPFSALAAMTSATPPSSQRTDRSNSAKSVGERVSGDSSQPHVRPASQPRPLGPEHTPFQLRRAKGPLAAGEPLHEEADEPTALASDQAPPVGSGACVTPAAEKGSPQQASPSASPGAESGVPRRSGSGKTRITPRPRSSTSGGAQKQASSPGPSPGQEDSETLAQGPSPSTNVPPVAQDAISYYQGQGQANLNLTLALKVVRSEAKHDDIVSERMQHWAQVFRGRGSELRQAVDEWQTKNGVERGVLTTGFLDGTHPLVDVYELKVRLDHMLRRLRVLEEAAAAKAPAKILPGLYVGGAVSADSHYLLRHLGITSIVNATQEVLPPPETAGFQVLVVPLRDTDDEDIMLHFERVNEFIEEARGRLPKASPPDPLLMLQRAPPTKPALPSRKQRSHQPRSGTPPQHPTAAPPPLPPTRSASPPPGISRPRDETPSPVPLRSRFSDGGSSSPARVATPDRPIKRHASATISPSAEGAGHEPTPPAQALAGTPSPNAQRTRRNSCSGPPPAGVLVHCSEGKSRSVTLVLNYLMQVQGWTLKDALLHVRRTRPIACPNAGFMTKLMDLDVKLHGRPSLRPGDEGLGLKRGKPEPRVCPVCGAKVGVSSASLAVHMKSKHPDKEGGVADSQGS